MSLTLEDILNERNGIISFTNNLQKNVSLSVYPGIQLKYLKFINTLGVHPVLPFTREKGEDDEAYQERLKPYEQEMKERVTNYENDFKLIIEDLRIEYITHLVGIKAYIELFKEHEELVKNYPDKKESPIIKESEHNLQILKNELGKIQIYDFELDDALNGDKKLPDKIIHALYKDYTDKIEALGEKYQITTSLNSKEQTKAFGELLDIKNLKYLNIPNSEMNDNNYRFYALVHNQAYEFTYLPDEYEQRDNEFVKPVSGYKMNEKNEMVPDTDGNFFTRIIKAIKRSFNKKKAKAYNQAYNEAKEKLKTDDYLNEKLNVENKKPVEVTELNQNKSLQKQNFLKEMQLENQKIAGNNKDIKVGPSLDEID